MLQPRPGNVPLKVGNNGQGYQVIAYQVLGNDPSGKKRHARRNTLAIHKLPQRGGAFSVAAHGNAANVGRLHLRIQPIAPRLIKGLAAWGVVRPCVHVNPLKGLFQALFALFLSNLFIALFYI